MVIQYDLEVFEAIQNSAAFAAELWECLKHKRLGVCELCNIRIEIVFDAGNDVLRVIYLGGNDND